jgi:probable O-glycosylation ligase (exosortase A-associated)
MGVSDIVIFVAYVGLLAGGFLTPFVSTLGYVWIDSFYPQYLSDILKGVPVAAVMGAGALLTYVLMDRRSAPRIGMYMILCGALAVWMTATLTWAVRPNSAWLKWDWASKAVLFAGFLPFVIRSRVQLEALLQTHMLASAMHLIAVGIKGLLTGGGYKWRMTALPADSGLVESSAMATVAMMFIPLLFYMREHSILVPWTNVRNIFYPTYALLCVTAMVGTGARTGLVCLAVLAMLYWLLTRHKVAGAVAIMMLGVLLLVFSPDRWKERMGTIDDYKEESSALTRIKVWQWAIDFVADNPMGGGFRAYEINVIRMPPDNMNPDGWVQTSRAPHSTWFELLNELGWPGFFMFLGLIFLSFSSLWRIWKRCEGIEELRWCRDLARALGMSLLVLMAGSSFIGIAFQPWYWMMFACSFILSEYVRRCLEPERKPGTFVRDTPSANLAGPVGVPPVGVPGLSARRRV